MSFDNPHPRRKDRRRPYRGSGRFDRSCRPGGDCPWCRGNRAYATLRRLTAAIEDEREFHWLLARTPGLREAIAEVMREVHEHEHEDTPPTEDT